MEFSLSTHWNTYRHATGEAMIEEILGLGLTSVELGYDLRIDMVAGVKHMVQSGAVRVVSVHNFCPVPMGAHRGHPELYTPASPDPRTRENCITHMTRTIAFAAEVGAKVVVAHAGNVDMSRMSRDLIEWCQTGRQYTPAYEKLKMKTQVTRDKKVGKQLGYLRDSIDRLLPVLEQHKIILAFENLPTWEAIPTEIELEGLLTSYQSPWLRGWYDFGHGQIRQNLGFINAERWVTRLTPWMAGMHIHDVKPPVQDHVMPPRGHIPFDLYREFAQGDVVRVIEPAPGTAAEEIKEAIAFLRQCWQSNGPVAESSGKTI
ncbi:MAG TPA: TIM barrel protein [Kiritimatiellia bacterium]|nr:TIM barrel protein [Kiritimatiellia bacterium]HMO99664.1 TIM barrel protein [Kiritimatiellia bacterium]HMP96162.1 TIM barrel protein [Kiritimatiellia bacterium]